MMQGLFMLLVETLVDIATAIPLVTDTNRPVYAKRIGWDAMAGAWVLRHGPGIVFVTCLAAASPVASVVLLVAVGAAWYWTAAACAVATLGCLWAARVITTRVWFTREAITAPVYWGLGRRTVPIREIRKVTCTPLTRDFLVHDPHGRCIVVSTWLPGVRKMLRELSLRLAVRLDPDAMDQLEHTP